MLIKARQAGDALNATPMDRPEDFETNPVSGRVYAVMTKSAKRKPDQVDAANPRPENKWGHIVELIPPGDGANADHAAGAIQVGRADAVRRSFEARDRRHLPSRNHASTASS